MAEVFVDTSAWYPAIVGSHADHQRVAGAVRDAVRAGARLVTTNLVVAEAHALLLYRAGRSAALQFLEAVNEPPTTVVASSPTVERRAIAEWLARYADQDFSFADAVSFTVMKERGILQVLTLDAHFTTAGFRALPAAPATRSPRSPPAGRHG